MRQLASILLLAFSSVSNAQIVYSGFIDKYPVEFILEVNLKTANAIYTYTNYDEPIQVDGTIENGLLKLIEKDQAKVKATLEFKAFDKKADAIKGVWKDSDSAKSFPIVLTKNFEIVDGYGIAWPNREIRQNAIIDGNYFKVVVAKNGDDYYPKIIGVKIFETKTDKLLQEFNVEATYRQTSSISIDDYNFDDLNDFSILEESYAGPNTSSRYFLYDAQKKIFFESGFSGISLEFDKRTKRIIERNQCCAGTSVTTAEYKIENNQMILLSEHCYKWSEKKQKLVERPLTDCK